MIMSLETHSFLLLAQSESHMTLTPCVVLCGSAWFFFPQTISLLVYVSGGLGKKGPFLILSPLSVMENWRQELERYSSPAERITNRP